MTSQTKIPCVLMRGGTSKGTYFLASDLPADEALRDHVLLSVMGSPDARQIDGVKGANPLTSKVAVKTIGTKGRSGLFIHSSRGGRAPDLTQRTAVISWPASVSLPSSRESCQR